MIGSTTNVDPSLVASHLSEPSFQRKLTLALEPLPTSIPAFSLGAPEALLFSVIILSARLIVSVLTVVVVPLTVKLPLTIRLLLTVVFPELAPIFTAVPAPAKFTVVAVVLIRLNVVQSVVISQPFTLRSPDSVKLSVKLPVLAKLTVPSTTRLFLIVVVPVVALIVKLVAAPAKFIAVADEFNRLKELAVVVISPPFTAKSPVRVVFPVTASVPLMVSLPVTASVVPFQPKLALVTRAPVPST